LEQTVTTPVESSSCLLTRMANHCTIDVNQGPTSEHEKSTAALLPQEPVNYDAEEGVLVQPEATPKEKFDQAGFLKETGTAVRRSFCSGYVRPVLILLGLLIGAIVARNYYLDQYGTIESDLCDYPGQDDYGRIEDLENEVEYQKEEIEQLQKEVSESTEEAEYNYTPEELQFDPIEPFESYEETHSDSYNEEKYEERELAAYKEEEMEELLNEMRSEITEEAEEEDDWSNYN